MAKRRLMDDERMVLLRQKSLEFAAGRMDEAAPGRPWFATLGIPGNDRVRGLLEIGTQEGRWYVLAGAMPEGTDRLTSQYLVTGTRSDIAAFLAAPQSAATLETTLRETVKQAEKS